jgi:hypothetical protein
MANLNFVITMQLKGLKELDEVEDKVKGLDDDKIEPKFETKKVKKSIDSLEKEIKQLEKQFKSSAVGGDDYKQSMERLKQKKIELKSATSGLNNQIEKEAKQQKNLTGIVTAVSTAYLAFSQVLQQVQAGFQKAVNLKNFARDATEVKNKFNGVFDSIQKKANETMTGFADTYKLADSTAQKMLSGAGNLLVGFGFSEDFALKLSERVNALAIDLTSFTNVEGGAERASVAFTKAILGETESAKAYEVVLRQNTAEFRRSVKALMENEGMTYNQAMAVTLLNDAVEQSTKAMGDFARTQFELANKERVLEEAQKTLREEMGKRLLPLFSKGTDMALDFTESLTNMFQGHRGQLKDVISATTEFEKQAKGLTSLKEEYESLKGKTSLNTEEQERLRKVIQEISEVIPTAATGFDVYGNAIDINSSKIDTFINKQRASLRLQFQGEIKDLVGDFESKVVQYSSLYDKYFTKKERLNKITKEYANYAESVVKAYGSIDKAPKGIQDTIDKYNKMYSAARTAFDEINKDYTTETPAIFNQLNNMIQSLEGAGIDFSTSPSNIAYLLGLDLKKDKALIDQLINRWDMLQSTAKRVTGSSGAGQNEKLISPEEIEKAKQQIDAFFLSIAAKKEQLAANYEDKKSLIETAFVNDPEMVKAKIIELDEWYETEQEKLRKSEEDAVESAKKKAIAAEELKYKAAIELIAAKKQAGKATEQDLMEAEQEYSAWLKIAYGEESKQYIKSLNDKEKATKLFWRKNHEFATSFIDSMVSGFKTAWNSILDTEMTGKKRSEAIWESMKSSFMNTIGEMVSDYLKAQLMKIVMAETVGTVERSEIAKTQVMEKASILSTIALKIKSALVSVGQAVAAGFAWLVSTLGPFGLAAGIALGAGIIAAFNGIRSNLGFASGGYSGAGQKYEVAGVVHKDEVIFESEITRPNLPELMGLRSLMQKGYKLKELLMPSVDLPVVNFPTPQVAYAGGGHAGGSMDFGKIVNRLERIENAIKNKKLSGKLELKDSRNKKDRYEVHLEDKQYYENRNS